MNVHDAQPQRLILFDGVCAVCDAGMTWIMDHDPEGLFAYAALQGDTAAAILARHPELPANLDSIVFVDRTSGTETVSWFSDAVFDIAEVVPGPYKWFALFRWVPRFVRDAAYRAFARIRYRVFGTIDHCRMPSESEAARMLP